VTKSGIGSQTFSGANNYGGTTTIGGGTLTLGASNALPNGGTVALTGGTLSLAGNSQTVGGISGTSNINLGGGAITINFSTGVYSGVISGTGGSVTKVSTGQLTLSGASTYTGGTNINDGTVQISGSADRLPTTGAVAMNGGTLDLNNLNQTVGGVSGSSSILLGSGVLTISPASGSSTYTGVIAGSGSVNKLGFGSQTFSGANSYTGTTTINGGSLLLGATNALPTAGTLAMTGGTLVLNGNNQTVGTLTGTSSINLGANTLTFSSSSGTYTGVISGAGGNIVKQSTGVATFGGGSTYTGVTTITGGGTLAVATLANGGASSGIGASTNANANLVLNNGVLRFVGASTNTSNRGYTLGAGGGGFDASGVGAATLTLSGSMSAPSGGGQTLSLFGSNTGNNTHSGQITDGTIGNVTSLTKDGAGKWLLANANNTYTGVTTVTNGTLALSAASNNILNSPQIAVGSGATLDVTGLTAGLTLNTGQTLSGNGSVVGTVNLTNTSTIAPGASAGKLTFSGAGNISLSTSATVDMEIGAPTTPGTTYDQIVITNASAKVLSLNGAKLKLTPNAGIVTGTAYTLITNSASSASISLASVFKNLDNTDLLETGGPYAQGPLSFTVDYDATFVKITFTTVPEPSSAVALVLLGAPALMQRRRRRR
jgi:fibronectin-binding autotransporter adhesin